MSAMPSPTAELADIKTNLAAEISDTEEADARKERSISQPSLEPGISRLKPTTSIISDKDASGKKPADQTAETAATETLEKNSEIEKIEATSDAAAKSSAADDSTAKESDVQLDLKSEEQAEHEGHDKVSCEEFRTEDSHDTDDSTEESDSRIKRFDPYFTYFRSVEYRMDFFEQELKELKELKKPYTLEEELKNIEELKKLQWEDTKAKAKPQLVVEAPSPVVSEVVPSIRRMNWADFKPSRRSQEARRTTRDGLRFREDLQEVMDSRSIKVSGNQQDGTPDAISKHQHHVLEVLVEDPGASKSRRVKKQTDDGKLAKESSQEAKTYEKGDNINSQTSLAIGTPILQCPERVRICSPAILEFLRGRFELGNQYGRGTPHMVFLRPFKFFVRYEAGIRAALKNLEKRWQSIDQTNLEQTSGRNNEEPESDASKSNDTSSQKDDTTAAEVSSDPVVKTDTLEALQHLRLLVDFMDDDLKSTFALRRQIKSKNDCSIAFSDLWHLYEHGQEVRTPGDQIQVFKVASFTGGRDLLSESTPRGAPEVPPSCIQRQKSKGTFFVECYRYDFNGTQYGPVETMFEIRSYEGLRNVTSLQVYPLWFDPDHQNERVRLLRRGEKFIALARVNRTAHKSYHGLTLDEHAEEVSWSNTI